MITISSRTPKIALFMAVATLCMPTLAHAGLLDSVAQLLSQHISPTDESMAMLKNVVGDFAVDPFAQSGGSGGAGSALGSMFKVFNMFIFSVAMIWFAYNSAASLAQTMHEGVVLGQRMSTIWVPIRVTFGSVSLMPIFGGWAFCQALMVMAATLGIAGANAVQSEGIKSAANFQTMVNPMGSVKQAATLHNVELNILRMTACQRAAGLQVQEFAAFNAPTTGDISTTTYKPVFGAKKDSVVMNFAGKDGQTSCGQIALNFSPRSNEGGLSSVRSGSAFGFRIEGINYDNIRRLSEEAHKETLQAVQERANNIISKIAMSNATPGDTATISGDQAEAAGLINGGYFQSYNTIFQEKIAALTEATRGQADQQAISDALLARMETGGWATLGAWYSVYAEVNEGMNEMLDPSVTITQRTNKMTTFEEDMVSAIEGAINKAKSIPDALETPTGNHSLGQWLLGGALNGLVGTSGTGAGNTINPIITFKNIGDNALTFVQTAYFVYKGAEALGVGKDKGGIGGALMDVAGGIASKNPITGFLMSVVEDAGSLLIPLGLILFATAAAMAFYIPMIPFIQWFAGLLQWFTSVLESLIGSSLWALAHFDSDGEGMGQRASYGYLYMLNNFARPIVMVFAFFIASAAITVLGTFLFKYFGTVVASAQGNSLTGLMSIVAYLSIFTILGITLVNGAFSIMLHQADKVVGWVGQVSGSEVGRDVENRVNAVFLQAARAPQQILMKPKPPGAGGIGASIGGGGGGGGGGLGKDIGSTA